MTPNNGRAIPREQLRAEACACGFNLWIPVKGVRIYVDRLNDRGRVIEEAGPTFKCAFCSKPWPSEKRASGGEILPGS